MRITSLSLFLFAGCLLVIPWHASHADTYTPTPGDLIKASGPSVYFVGADDKRYVFPNSQTYFTWYSDFSSVKTIDDSDLGSIMIGGNVTYRPGVKLVKVTTDPKVYAVDHDGQLRWVETEDVATSLYGSNWNHQVDDIPDAFFVNYKVGAPIVQTSDYNPQQVMAADQTILQDMTVVEAPMIPVVITPTTTITPTITPNIPVTTTSTTSTPDTMTSTTTSPYSASLTLLNINPIYSQNTFSVQALPIPSGGIQAINVSFDDVLQQSCTSDYCVTQLTAPTVSVTSTYAVSADFHWLGGGVAYATTTVTVYPVAVSDQISLTVPSSDINGSNRDIVVNLSDSFSGHEIYIYMDGNLAKECDGVQNCTYTDTEGGTPGTSHSVYATANDGNGDTIQSDTKTILVASS